MVEQIKRLNIERENDIALIDANSGHKISWKGLYEKALYIAEYLKSISAEQQNNIAIIIDNCIEWFFIFFGSVMTESTIVVINPHDTIDNIYQKVNSLKCTHVFFDKNIKDKIEKVAASLDKQIKFISLDSLKLNEEKCCQDNAIGKNLYRPELSADLRRVKCVYFSSGTTGNSKAVVLPLHSLIATGKTEIKHHQQTSEDVFLCAAPLYHVGAFAHWLGSLFSGSRAVLYRIETPHKILYTIEKYKVTIAWLLLPWVEDILGAIDVGDINLNDYNLGLWRLMHMGAQPIPETTVERWRNLFPDQQFDINYGLTESGGPGCIHLGLETAYKPQMLGVIDEEWELGINNSGKVSKIINSIGEICVKGPSVMECYYNDPQATMQVLSDDGWLFTGDMGYINEEGYVFYTGRKKDLIIVGGENIYPLEIENHIKKISNIKDVAVIGLPNNRLGEVAVAIIELSGENTEETMRKEIRRQCRSLPVYKQPVKIFFDTIPRNSTGKIDKKQLRSKYALYRSDKIYE